MAAIALTKAELAGIQKIGSLLTNLSKVIGTDEFNELRFYEEQQVAKAASISGRKKTITEKTNIEKFLD